MIKERIKNLNLNEVAILIFVFIIALILVLVKIVLKDTHAYYGDSVELPLFNAKVGDFSGDGEGESVKNGPLTDRDTDVNIIFYTQMPDNPNRYMISKYIPANGYKVNSTKSNCYPAKGSVATYKDNNYYTINEDGSVHVEYDETKPTQVVCRIYYDRDKLSDVIIYAYVEDENGNRKYNDKTYKLVNIIDSSYTEMNNYECTNKTIETTFTYDVNKGFHIDTKGPNTCYAYFNK